MPRGLKPPPKIQRWIDILAVLLSHRYAVSLDDLIAGVPAYQGGSEKAESRRRKFERDKDELRRFGIPIETATDEHGEPKLYRLPPRDFYLPYLSLRLDGRASKPRRVGKYGYGALPTLSFEPEELEAIAHAAARVRQLGDPLLAEHAESAVRKLAVDLPLDATRADETGVAPARSQADAETFAALTRRSMAGSGSRSCTAPWRAMPSPPAPSSRSGSSSSISIGTWRAGSRVTWRSRISA